MLKRLVTALAALTIASPALAAPFDNVAGRTHWDTNLKTHPEFMTMLWENAQWGQGDECDPQDCYIGFYTYYQGSIYHATITFLNGKITDIDLINSAPVGKRVYFEIYLQKGSIIITDDCRPKYIIDVWSDMYVNGTPEVPGILYDGYSCPV